jgi:hypothetical protein
LVRILLDLAISRNMIASMDHSIGKLKRWRNERTSLFVVFVADGLMFSFDGFIKSFVSDSFIVGKWDDPASDKPIGTASELELHITMEKIRRIDELEPRGNTDHSGPGLKFTMTAGALHLQEFNRPPRPHICII